MESFPTLCSPFPHMPLSELPRSPSGWEKSFPWGWERTFRRVLPVPTVTPTGGRSWLSARPGWRTGDQNMAVLTVGIWGFVVFHF